jgi:hypothetical protein
MLRCKQLAREEHISNKRFHVEGWKNQPSPSSMFMQRSFRVDFLFVLKKCIPSGSSLLRPVTS